MKKYLIGFTAIVLAIGLNAFTGKKPTALAGEKWFHFSGNATIPAQVGNVAYYSLDGTGATPTVCLSPSPAYLCEILTQPQVGNPSKPNLSLAPISETKRNTP